MPKQSAPHLPEEKGIVKKQASIAFGAFFSFALIALVAGVAATLATVAWIAPDLQTNTAIYTIQTARPVATDTPLDALVEQQVRQRMVDVYVQEDTDQTVFAEQSRVGIAVLLSAQGWAALYPTKETQDVSESSLVAVTYQGDIVPIETMTSDSLSDVVYIKLAHGEYRADVSFIQKNELASQTPLVAVSYGHALPVLTDGTVSLPGHTDVYPLWKPQFTTRLIGEVQGGEMIVTARGAFLGFARPDGTLFDSWRIEEQLLSLFQAGSLSYAGLSYIGYPVLGVIEDDVFQTQSGFYVQKIENSVSPRQAPQHTTSTIQVGDVIITIHGQPFDKHTAAEVIATAPDSFLIDVWRDGETYQVVVEKTPVLSDT